ncbi:MAG: amidohydrolase family protein [Thermoanaerobaculia bacterium]|nr:amidohydrolase family protein [Thermoanaerobaculia bacterium]
MSRGDLLVRGATLVTMDAAARVLPDHDLRVRGGRIVAMAPGLAADPEATRVVEAGGCYVLPGLVQGHLHLGQTLFRGLGERRRLLAWLRERIWPLEAAHDADSARASALLGAAECLLGGTTTIQEIGLGPEAEALLDGIVESGLGGFAGKCLMDSGDGLPERLREPTAACLDEAERLGDRLAEHGAGRLRPVLNPRFALSCSHDLLAGVAEIAARRGWPVHTHALEQRDETAAVRAAWGGRDEIELFRDLGLLDRDLRIAHGVWLRRRDLPELARRRFSVVHCPSSNLKLGSGIARVGRLRRAGIPVGLGADGAPCNDRLDAWSEMRLAGQLQSLREGPAAFGGLDALRLATSEGARALGLEEEVGSLEIGKRGDLVVVAPERPELAVAGAVDPHDLLAFAAGRESVRDVAIAGELHVEGGRLTRLDLEGITRTARVAADRVARRAGIA